MEDDYTDIHKVSAYLRAEFWNGTVVAVLFNKPSMGGKFRITEDCVYTNIRCLKEHLEICPVDKRAEGEVKVLESALADVQEEKLRRGIHLDAPRMNGPPILKVLVGGLEP